MGSNVSSVALTTLEILNEIWISMGAGILGVLLLMQHGIKDNNYMQCLFISTITIGSLVYVFQTKEYVTPSQDKIVLITGCDTGLGFSLAQHICEMGFTVIAGCLKLDSDGAKELRHLFGTKIHHVELDITRSTSVEVAVEVLERFFKRNPQYILWALVNNVGVMIFGEFEWFTEKLIHQQVDVNLIGTFRLTKGFLPLLRKYKGRIINVSSHCALACLPGLSVYGATKAALLAWNNGLRVEMAKYGVSVVSFIPGSFALQSNIMMKQKEHSLEMLKHFTPEQNDFYGDYFKRYNSYLNPMSGPKPLIKIPDPSIYKTFEQALLDRSPKGLYVNQPLRYLIYHNLFKYSPLFLRDYLVVRFMQMPTYEVTPVGIEILA